MVLHNDWCKYNTEGIVFDSMSNKFYHKKTLSQGYMQRYKSKNYFIIMTIMLKL